MRMRWKLIVPFIIFIVILGVVGVINSRKAATTGHDIHAKHKKQLYQCPMHPTYISDKPGECPICGMTLVPIESEEVEEEAKQEVPGLAPVRIAYSRQQLIGVTTEAVKFRPLTKIIRTVGWIAYDPELYRAQEEYLQAIKGAELVKESTFPEAIKRAEKLVESARFRLKLLGLNDREIEALSKRVGPDQSLLLGETMEGNVWLYATIYEYEIGWIHVGQAVEITVNSFPGESFKGEIRAIDTVVDPKTRSVKIRAIIPNADNRLKPQMFANARIVIDTGEKLAVPESAVMDTGVRQVVYVAEDEGLFKPRVVSLGAKVEGYYIVKDGLVEDERVVTSGNFLIDSESRLRGAIGKTKEAGHQH